MTTPPHDCKARLNQLQATLEKNKDRLVDQQVQLEKKQEGSAAREK